MVRWLSRKNVFVDAVPCKGADEDDFVATLAVKDILWLGYVELIVRTDSERALQALVTRSLDVLRVRALRDKEANLERECPARPRKPTIPRPLEAPRSASCF